MWSNTLHNRMCKYQQYTYAFMKFKIRSQNTSHVYHEQYDLLSILLMILSKIYAIKYILLVLCWLCNQFLVDLIPMSFSDATTAPAQSHEFPITGEVTLRDTNEIDD